MSRLPGDCHRLPGKLAWFGHLIACRAILITLLGGAQSCIVQAIHRAVVLELIRRMGATVQKNMHVASITHIVAKDVHEQSAKLTQARRYNPSLLCSSACPLQITEL